LLLEVGFLINRLKMYGLIDDANNLEARAKKLIKDLDRSNKLERVNTLQQELSHLAENAWQTHYKLA